MALHHSSKSVVSPLIARCLPVLLAAGVALTLSGCGGSQPPAGDSRGSATSAAAGATPSQSEDIRNKTGPFYNERYMPVGDRFKVRRERLLSAIGAQ